MERKSMTELLDALDMARLQLHHSLRCKPKASSPPAIQAAGLANRERAQAKIDAINDELASREIYAAAVQLHRLRMVEKDTAHATAELDALVHAHPGTARDVALAADVRGLHALAGTLRAMLARHAATALLAEIGG